MHRPPEVLVLSGRHHAGNWAFLKCHLSFGPKVTVWNSASAPRHAPIFALRRVALLSRLLYETFLPPFLYAVFLIKVDLYTSCLVLICPGGNKNNCFAKNVSVVRNSYPDPNVVKVGLHAALTAIVVDTPNH